jgi:glutamate racemase
VSAPPTILVFDSGLGGLTVLREIVRARPDAHYIYVADDAFFPYGHHGEDQIIARVVPLVGELIAVSVLGTRGTVKREYTRALIRDFAQGCEVTLVGSADLASLAESALSGEAVSDGAISAELAPCFVGSGAGDPDRTDTVVLACTHYPLLMDRLVQLAPWPVDWIDPAPAIARRVSDLLGAPGSEADHSGAEMIFTSKRPHTLSQALMPFFGGRVPA